MNYTGTGSTDLDLDDKRFLVELAMHLDEQGWKARTGIRTGSEEGFRTGAKNKIIFTTHFNPDLYQYTAANSNSILFAEKMWKRLSLKEGSGIDFNISVEKLRMFAMECHMFLGEELNEPSTFAIIHRPLDEKKLTSELIAEDIKIPIINTASYQTKTMLKDMLRKNANIHNVLLEIAIINK